MTLNEAVEAAFGRTDRLSRTSWPKGSIGVLDPLWPNDSSGPFLCTAGNAVHVIPNRHADLEADDWYPCTLDAEPVEDDWRPALSVNRDGETRCIGRGDTCTATLDDLTPAGDCVLLWLTPNFLTLRVPRDRVDAWPSNGPHRLVHPKPRLSLLANGIEVGFRIHSIDMESRLETGDRLYRLWVTQAAPEPELVPA